MDVCRSGFGLQDIPTPWGRYPISHLVSPPSLSCGHVEECLKEKLQTLGSMSKVLQLIREGTKLASCLHVWPQTVSLVLCGPLPSTLTCPAALEYLTGTRSAAALSVSPLGQADTAVMKMDKIPADIYHSVSKV